MIEQITSRPKVSHYRLSIAICLFLVLDCSILGINFWITAQVERDALAINIAGRQRMLSQRLTKAVLLLEHDRENRAIYQQELAQVYQLFNSTLIGFKQGGVVLDGNGEAELFNKVDDAYVQKYISQAEEYIHSLSSSVEGLVRGDFSVANIATATELAQKHNLKILELMNNLTSRMETLSKGKTQSLRWMQTTAFAFALINFIIIIRLFLQRSQQAEGQVKNFLDLVDHAAACLIVLDADMRILLANRMSQDLFGYSDAVINRLSFDELIYKRDGEWYGVRRDGSVFRVELSRRNFQLHENQLLIMTVNDISHHTEEQARLAHLANHDALTGLVNRRALYDRLALEARHARRSGKILSVFFLDLNNFKPVNDELGHAVGDRLLTKVAQRLLEITRDTDTVARFGGDEFVIVFTEASGLSEVEGFSRKLEQAFATPFLIDDTKIPLQCSHGYACFPEEARNASELIELADQRMYENKKVFNKTDTLTP